MDTYLVSAPLLQFNAALLDFYVSVAAPEVQPVLAAVRTGASPKAIIASLDMSPLEIEEVLKDLVRKHVIVFDGEEK